MAASKSPAKKTEEFDGERTLVELKSKKNKPEVETVELFSIDGVTYSVPTSVPTRTGLRYVSIARKQGPEAAADYMLEVMLGEEGYNALLNFDDLEEEDLQNVMEACAEIMTAATEKAPNR